MKLRLKYSRGYFSDYRLKNLRQAERFIDGSFHNKNCKMEECKDCPCEYSRVDGTLGCSCNPHFISAEIIFEKMWQHKIGRFYE